jgi:hypothetical protein
VLVDSLNKPGGARPSSTVATTGAAAASNASISDSVKAARRQQRMKDRFAEERKRILVKQGNHLF